jgi:Tfp pilus assembly protein PilE
MVVVAIVGILAMLVVPGYGAYVARSRVLDAATLLADHRTKMEQYFLDRRAYTDADGACGAAPAAPVSGDTFAVTCVATQATYLVTATGRPGNGMAAFAFAIDHAGARTTLSVPAGWTLTGDCWTYRPDGSCL